jgi:hypothetical protein
VSQQRTTVLALLPFAFIAIAVKVDLLVPFDQAAEAWTQRHITPLHTTLMLTVTRACISWLRFRRDGVGCGRYGSPEIRLLARQARPERAGMCAAQ